MASGQTLHGRPHFPLECVLHFPETCAFLLSVVSSNSFSWPKTRTWSLELRGQGPSRPVTLCGATWPSRFIPTLWARELEEKGPKPCPGGEEADPVGFHLRAALLGCVIYLWVWSEAGTRKSPRTRPQTRSLSEASSHPTGHRSPGSRAPGCRPVPWRPCPGGGRGAGRGGGGGKGRLPHGCLATQQRGKQNGRC